MCLCTQNLKWLDLKDNPLEINLAKAAGDCLDEKQCKQCAARVRLGGRQWEGRQREVEEIPQLLEDNGS